MRCPSARDGITLSMLLPKAVHMLTQVRSAAAWLTDTGAL
jgi:hypothetical protein